jgi:L-alanine-DL-glutamate epimerase-like enolase superfamily enzyme
MTMQAEFWQSMPMPAPVDLVHSHTHSLRIASGEEALVVRVLTRDGAIGVGFTLNLDAAVARDMAAWDAAARRAGCPLWKLLGGQARAAIPVLRASGEGLDPWSAGGVEAVLAARPRLLVAPHAHPWEIAWCATLAASLGGGTAIAVPGEPKLARAEPANAPGHGIDWSSEPLFSGIRWSDPARAS